MKKIYKIVLLLLVSSCLYSQNNTPKLILTFEDVQTIRESLGKVPLFDHSLTEAKRKVDEVLNVEIVVPIPKDAGGGYTHEKHKQNYNEMFLAGIIYQFTQESKYAEFVKVMLTEYAKLYPTLGKHPQGKKQTPGRLFWQTLNESVFLLHTSQAYDCVYNYLSGNEREFIEKNLFYPITKFFLAECTHDFDKIHNHGTWMTSAVGMAGFVLNDKSLVNKSLYGSKEDGKTGFLSQLDNLFSPDGYYTEGGYYARYALWPFFIYTEVLNNNKPELDIYNYRDGILRKALYSALQVTSSDGRFIPVNDAIKEKNWLTPELIYGVNFIYSNCGENKELLSLAMLQESVSLNIAGLNVAKALADKENIKPFIRRSIQFSDGPKGDWGGVSILRSGSLDDMMTLFFKHGSHGLSHGHYDKLSYCFYDQNREILQDYGAARFLNTEQKFGGRYLPENKTFAKQTVAHNTLVVDGKSQYNGKQDKSQANHSQNYLFNIDDPEFQYASAKENNAYKGVKMQRTLCMINQDQSKKGLVLDIYRVEADDKHQYDMPFYYLGHLISTSFEYKAFTETKSLMGSQNGYQHLWKEAVGTTNKCPQVTWINGSRFYSITSNAFPEQEVLLTRIGGSDPNYNLRNESGFMLRRNDSSTIFVNIIEPHGIFDPKVEFTSGSYSSIENIDVIYNNSNYTIIEVVKKDLTKILIQLANNNSDYKKEHVVSCKGKTYSWLGPISLIN
ncbi:MAG: alginate lyase family protein [Melioribacteraceae bacterium]|nr:alginate lyase family protein [Melioribacteraceae bacterium]